MRALITGVLFTVLSVSSAPVEAQPAAFVYRLGKDTLAIEQFTRSATAVSGEMVQRNGAAVVRVQYTMALGTDGRPTAATIKRLQGDGTPVPNSATETRFQVRPDSIVQEIVWPDSVQRRAFAAAKALINFPVFAFGPTEILSAIKRAGGATDSIPALGATGNLGFTGLSPAGGDTVRLRGGAYAMVLRFDAAGRLLVVDGSGTTNKVTAIRSSTRLNVAELAKTMKPSGVLSAREDTRAAFGPGGMVVVDYGRPMVRERTVWGGTLVPYDSVWRAGANDATHLMTTRTLTFGTLTLAPGMYTLWVQHTRAGTFLIVNKQIGQWGTQYDPAQDLGRVLMQQAAAASHVEEFTVAVRATGATRGALEMAWGPSVMSVPFTVSAARP